MHAQGICDLVDISKTPPVGMEVGGSDVLCCPAEPEVVPVLEELPKWGLLIEVMQVCLPTLA